MCESFSERRARSRKIRASAPQAPEIDGFRWERADPIANVRVYTCARAERQRLDEDARSASGKGNGRRRGQVFLRETAKADVVGPRDTFGRLLASSTVASRPTASPSPRERSLGRSVEHPRCSLSLSLILPSFLSFYLSFSLSLFLRPRLPFQRSPRIFSHLAASTCLDGRLVRPDSLAFPLSFSSPTSSPSSFPLPRSFTPATCLGRSLVSSLSLSPPLRPSSSPSPSVLVSLSCLLTFRTAAADTNVREHFSSFSGCASSPRTNILVLLFSFFGTLAGSLCGELCTGGAATGRLSDRVGGKIFRALARRRAVIVTETRSCDLSVAPAPGMIDRGLESRLSRLRYRARSYDITHPTDGSMIRGRRGCVTPVSPFPGLRLRAAIPPFPPPSSPPLRDTDGILVIPAICISRARGRAIDTLFISRVRRRLKITFRRDRRRLFFRARRNEHRSAARDSNF